MNHRGGVSSQRGGQSLVLLTCEMVSGEGVAQSVRFACHVGLLTELDEMLLKSDLVQGPQLAGRERAKRFEPRGQSGADFQRIVTGNLTRRSGVLALFCANSVQTSRDSEFSLAKMVRLAGLEPARVSPLPPQSSVSANSTTCALGA